MNADQDTPTGIRGALRRLGRIIKRLISIPVQVTVQRDVLSSLRQETRQLGAASVESATYAASELREVSERVSTVDDRLARVERELAELRQVLERQHPAPDSESETLERRGEVARPPSS